MVNYEQKIQEGIEKYSKPIDKETYKILESYVKLKDKYNLLEKNQQKLIKKLNHINDLNKKMYYIK